MAHICPDCGSLCYCNGDIDDIEFGEDSSVATNCTCPCVDEAEPDYYPDTLEEREETEIGN